MTDQYVDHVMPQEHGHHVDVRWLRLRSAELTLRITGDGRLGLNASHHSIDDLTRALHHWELVARPVTFVHLDAAHRGLGTAACGPDTDVRHLVRGGHHEWSWTLEAQR